MKKITPKLVREYIKEPNPTIDKYDAGSILIVAGYGNMPGAAMLAGLSALRAGAGLVRIATKKELFQSINSFLPEAICITWDEASKHLGSFDAIAFGPGMGASKESKAILEEVLKKYKGKLLIDADGLNILAKDKKLRGKTGENTVLTPHEREGSRLLGVEEILDREEAVKSLSAKYNSVALLKGQGTLVTDGNRVLINTTGNPGMATAGSGDVLTGIITAFMGAGMRAFDAAISGAFIHGLAGDMAMKTLGTHGIIARDIANSVPFAIKEVL